jgi:c(7)-type cytochrome triheme protein
MKKSHIFLILIIIAISFVSVAMVNKNNGNLEENRAAKIKFSHKFHVVEQSVACADCHINASKSTSAEDKLFGDHTSCQTCHQEQIDNNCEFCHVDKDNPVAFENPKREIMFSHEKHVSMQNVNCETCHKGLSEVDYSSDKNMPNMETCNTCHNNTKASNICENCHTNFASLLPNDHRFGNYKREHKELVRVGAMEVNCTTCHEETFCQQCHDGASLTKFGKDGFLSDPALKMTHRDSPKLLNLQMVHEMNYRFTHSIDAKSKASDCYSCHEKETFCSTCHQAGGNITESQFKPRWHETSNFTTFGVGSGGGLHAEMARRDIESCISCHDVDGADATCVTCHVDPDGLRGTNPKTHEIGYMKDNHGDWHETNGAVCYTCHTDPNARPDGKPGIAFCGYCHSFKRNGD